ncbi:hypothetical protein F2Q69_00034874 [Brassica cretica]|uniref:Methyltransferase n=1 Tax=Brassica cretica TaxID=69181 RepID=A0A8S9SQJ5_BRACR|nr:hypothetical protein F2Q69_00034874 [Brassica cretica]
MSGIVNTIIASYQETSRTPPEIDCCLNYLPNNDFNMTFKWATSFKENLKMDVKGRCFVSGVPGSFYSRLFPSKSLHFVHSACSIHWLSKVPEGLEDNKKNVYIRNPCPLGSKNASDPLNRESCHYWSLLTDSLLDLVSEGIVQESDVDSFNLPFYDADSEEDDDDDETCRLNFGEMMASRKRSITEPMLVAHFGDAIIDRLFEKYAHNAAKYYIAARSCNKMTVNFVVSLSRK